MLGLLDLPGDRHEVGIQPGQRRRQLRLAPPLQALQHRLPSRRASSKCLRPEACTQAEGAMRAGKKSKTTNVRDRLIMGVLSGT